jgi:RimJ/RimL family protein N-acetyltransferase
MRALLDYAFGTLGLELVRLETFGDNLRAQRAFKKVGFTETQRRIDGNGRVDVRMELPRERWSAQAPSQAPAARALRAP